MEDDRARALDAAMELLSAAIEALRLSIQTLEGRVTAEEQRRVDAWLNARPANGQLMTLH